MEPDWTKRVPSWVICDWYYMLFIINIAVFVMLILSLVTLAFTNNAPKGFFGIQMFTNFILAVFAGTNSLFYYLLCDRALKPVQSYQTS